MLLLHLWHFIFLTLLSSLWNSKLQVWCIFLVYFWSSFCVLVWRYDSVLILFCKKLNLNRYFCACFYEICFPACPEIQIAFLNTQNSLSSCFSYTRVKGSGNCSLWVKSGPGPIFVWASLNLQCFLYFWRIVSKHKWVCDRD